jgi:hypothetical protein
VNAVETALRYAFILQNVNLEWHYFGENSPRLLDDAIAYCHELGATFDTYRSVIDEAKQLAEVEVTGIPKDANDKAREWWHRYHVHHHIVKLSDSALMAKLEEANSMVRRGESPPTGTTVNTKLQSTFDEHGFKTKYPDIYEKYLVSHSSRTFNIKGKIDLDELQSLEIVTKVQDAVEDFRRVQSRVDDSEERFLESHRKLLIIQQLAKFSETEKELAKCHLQVLCGSAPGIAELCTWERKKKPPKLDTKALRVDHPDEVEEFTSRTETFVAKIRKGAGGMAADSN